MSFPKQIEIYRREPPKKDLNEMLVTFLPQKEDETKWYFFVRPLSLWLQLPGRERIRQMFRVMFIPDPEEPDKDE